MGDYIQNMQRPNLLDEIIQVDSTVMLRTFLSSSARKAVLFSIILSLAMSHCIAEELEAIAYTLNEQILMIPLGTSRTSPQLETTIFKPPGLGPFPLVVINHGKASGNPRFDPRARFVVASREFLKRGYLVAIPMRPGFSNSTGTDISPGCNAESYGFLQGQAVSDVLTQLSKRPDVDPTRILVIGQSTGGLTTIAFSTTTSGGQRCDQFCWWSQKPQLPVGRFPSERFFIVWKEVSDGFALVLWRQRQLLGARFTKENA